MDIRRDQHGVCINTRGWRLFIWWAFWRDGWHFIRHAPDDLYGKRRDEADARLVDVFTDSY
jgi:hypothetical protein